MHIHIYIVYTYICCLPVTSWYKRKFDGANLKRLEFKRHGPCIQGRETLDTTDRKGKEQHTREGKGREGLKEGRFDE